MSGTFVRKDSLLNTIIIGKNLNVTSMSDDDEELIPIEWIYLLVDLLFGFKIDLLHFSQLKTNSISCI